MFLLRTTSLFGILSLQYLLLLILMYHETKEQSRPPSSFAFYNPLTFYFEKELLCPYVLILHCRSWMPYNITVHFTGSSFNVLYHVINLFLNQVSKLQKCVSTSSAIYSLLFNVRKNATLVMGRLGPFEYALQDYGTPQCNWNLSKMFCLVCFNHDK